MTRYRLTIATRQATTTFCIAAETELDANRKAAAIARRLNLPSAKIQLTTRHVDEHRAAPRLAWLSAPAPAYWGA